MSELADGSTSRSWTAPFRLHFLNPVPIRQVYERWVDKFQEPWASALTELKREIEEEG